MSLISGDLPPKAHNARLQLAQKPTRELEEREFVIFNKKTTTPEAQKQAYLDYSEKMLDFFDKNKDGKVTEEEYIQGNIELNYEILKQRYHSPNDERNLIKKMLTYNSKLTSNTLDTNSDGYISKEEYAMFVLMCDKQGGLPADGKFTLDDEEKTTYLIRMNQYNQDFINIYKNNPFLGE